MKPGMDIIIPIIKQILNNSFIITNKKKWKSYESFLFWRIEGLAIKCRFPNLLKFVQCLESIGCGSGFAFEKNISESWPLTFLQDIWFSVKTKKKFIIFLLFVAFYTKTWWKFRDKESFENLSFFSSSDWGFESKRLCL